MAAPSYRDRSTQCVFFSSSLFSPSQLSISHNNNTEDASSDQQAENSDRALPARWRPRRRGSTKGKEKSTKKQSAEPSYTDNRTNDSTGVPSEERNDVQNCRLTRLKRKRMSLPAPVLSEPADTATPTTSVGNRQIAKDAHQCRCTGPGDGDTPDGLLYEATTSGRFQAVESDTTAEDHNANANIGNATGDGIDLNSNACKARAKAAGKKAATKGRDRKAMASKVNKDRMVNISSLKPINARCSKSGMGLVVTYRPVFTTRRRTRRQTRATGNNANNNITSPVSYQDSGTNPQDPSIEDEERRDGSDVFGGLNAVSRYRRSSERETNVKKWLHDFPTSTSSKTRQRQTPSPCRYRKLPTNSFPYANANRSARKSPIPGPSWNPEELREPGSRSRSPYYMPNRRSRSPAQNSQKHSTSSLRPSRLQNMCSRSSPNMEEVFAGVKTPKTSPRRRRTHAHESSSMSPPLANRSMISEGWNITRSNSAESEDKSTWYWRSGEDRERGQGRSPRRTRSSSADISRVSSHHNQTSSTRKHRRHAMSRSRSDSRSKRYSHSSESVESRDGRRKKRRGRDGISKRTHHDCRDHRHGRPHGQAQSGVSACVVM